MQRNKNNIIEQIKIPVKLYIDDIKKIVNVFTDADLKVELVTLKARYESIEELVQNEDERIYDLEIKCYDPSISIMLEKNKILIFIEDDDLKSRGAFEKIKRILIEKRRRFWKILSSPLINGILMGFSILLFSTILINGIKNNYVNMYMFIPLAAFICIIINYDYNIKIDSKRYSLIILKKREESFFKRKKDDLLMAIITAVFGFIVGFMLGKFS